MNQFEHSIDILQDVHVPEPQNSVTLRLKKFGSPCVFFDLYGVLTAVELDHDFQLMAGEIDNVAAEMNLPAKMRTSNWEPVA